MVSRSDDSILQDIRQGGKACDAALVYLYKTHLQMVTRYITLNSGSAADAQDKFQDAIFVFVKQVREGIFQQKSSIKSYLMAIARNMWLNDLRRKGLQEKFVDVLEWEGEPKTESPHELTVSEELKSLVGQWMGGLSDACRQLLRMRFWEYKPMKEIASVLGFKNEQIAKNKQQRCFDSLRQKIQGQADLKEILEGWI